MTLGYYTVYERITVADVRSFLNSVDFDVAEFSVWLANKFNTALHRNFACANDFDLSSVHLAILGFKNKNANMNDLRNIIHFLVYHHYMVLYHKISKDHEIRIMRAKIAHHAGVSLEEYEKSD